MKERALVLGKEQPLLSILGEPESPVPGRPSFVLLNAGLVHRVGPHRLTTRLARALCDAGFRNVRFDLSGVGDSPVRHGGQSFEVTSQEDIRVVLDELAERSGESRFVLAGICSGADNALAAAERDPRVVGIVPIDGVAYRTRKYFVEHYAARLLRPEGWHNLGRRLLRSSAHRLDALFEAPLDEASEAPVPYVREFPPREVLVERLRSLVARNVQMFWIYTSGMPLYYNHERQFFEMFEEVDFKGTLRHAYLPHANHTFTERRSQNELIDSIVAWATEVF